MKLSMITCPVTGTIGGYTVTKETTMKQIDTAQLDITACQAQAAEYHARGFNCAQAVACTLAPVVGLDPQVAFTLTEGFGAGMGGMTETCGAISGAVAIMGFVMSDGMENPKTKGQTYKLSREIAKRFGEKNTTTVCGTLKGIGSDKGPLRSCPGCIDDAVEIVSRTEADEAAQREREAVVLRGEDELRFLDLLEAGAVAVRTRQIRERRPQSPHAPP